MDRHARALTAGRCLQAAPLLTGAVVVQVGLQEPRLQRLRKELAKMVERLTAERRLSLGQVIVGVVLLASIAAGLLLNSLDTLRVINGVFLAFWSLFVGLMLVVLPFASMRYRMPSKFIEILERDLPTYTIVLPVVREKDNLKPLVEAIKQLNYPAKLLQAILLLEEDDPETIEAVNRLDLPQYFEDLVVPAGGPKTKPNAMNFGLGQATGENFVVYDAEDRPESNQLRDAVWALRNSAKNVVCAQARLYFWNRTDSWITNFYWSEYVMHFEWVLAGLSKLKLVPPLGGTSNHFKTEALRKVAISQDKLPFKSDGYIGGWDPWNVTEDADLAGALALHDYRTIMFDSVTHESACKDISHADKQRRRWLKGYFHTGMVYTRHPLKYAHAMGPLKYAVYVLILLGTPLSLWLSLPYWGLTIAYFTTHSEAIRSLFPTPLFYAGVLLMVFGNLLKFYQMVVSCLHRNGETSVKYMLLVPLWWILSIYTAYMALWEFMVKPHHWHKTEHIQDLEQERIELGLTGT